MNDKTLSEINFLIVDDYAAIRAVLKTDLKSLGLNGEIFEASSADNAIKLIAELKDITQIHFIISDWEMENGLGIDLLRFVRLHPGLRKVPFLMLTSLGKKELVLQAIQAGVTDYLLKPWDKNELFQKIEKCWAKAQKS